MKPHPYRLHRLTTAGEFRSSVPYIPRPLRPAITVQPPAVKCPHCGAWTREQPCHNCGTPIPPVVAGGEGRSGAEVTAAGWLLTVIAAVCGVVGAVLVVWQLTGR